MRDDRSERPVTWAEVERLLEEFRRIARWALARERTRDLETTDLMHTALRRMFRGDDGWDYQRVWENPRHVTAWFRTTVIHALSDGRKARGAQKRGAHFRVSSLDELLESPGGLARDPDLLHDLCSSVERLAKTDPAASELLGLSLVMGFSNGEIAEVLGISERHSRRQLAAALRELRRLLEDAA